MAQERWRLDNTTYTAGAAVARDGTSAGNSEWLLVLPTGTGPNTTTSSYEGSRALLTNDPPGAGNGLLRFRQTNTSTNPAAGAYYIDLMVFIPTGVTGSISLGVCNNDTAVEYSWVELVASGGNYQATVKSYDNGAGTVTRAGPATAGAINAWCRVRILTTAKGVAQAELWTGSALPGTDGANENATATASTTNWNGGTFANWQYINLYGDQPAGSIRLDDVLFNSSTAPSRQPPNVQAAITGTGTVTAASTATRLIGATPSGTGTITAAAGRTSAIQASALSVAGSVSADAAVITTHNAEAYLTATGALDAPGTSVQRGMTAALVGYGNTFSVAATNTAAALVGVGAVTAKVRIEGETTPGRLYGRVIKPTID
jgi:hypothetical protein